MPRSAALNQQLRDARRERILREALRLFVRKGLAATGSAEIAVAAGASSGLVYHYFPSKEAIYIALVARAMEGSTEMTQRALRSQGTAWQRLRSVCVQMLQGISEDPDYTLLVLQANIGGLVPDEARRIIERHSRASFDDL